MNEIDKIKENQGFVENTNVDSLESISESDVKETSEKLETKGLKLKRSTKDKLNQLQGKFTDAETMVSTLISQYEAFNIKENSKYSDRKAEIDKFNYFLDSLRSGFLNSLEMSSYLEERYNQKLTQEINKKDNIIISLQDDNSNLKRELEVKGKELLDKEAKLEEVKESFSRVNLAMVTIEKELKDKSTIIESLKANIESLTIMVDENSKYKKINDELIEEIETLKDKLIDSDLVKQEVKGLVNDNDKLSTEIISLKSNLKTERILTLKLNSQIQEILINKNNEITDAREKYENSVRKLEAELRSEENKYRDINFELRERIYKLENELEVIKSNKNQP